MHDAPENKAAAFNGLIDLAAERLGGSALAANDEFFAPKENLLKPGRGVFIPGKYTDRGKWMDGWETRRRRTPGHDWCIVRLGLPGYIRGVDIDTNHFLGNHPPYASLWACTLPGEPSFEQLHEAAWAEVLPRSPLRPGAQNLFGVRDDRSRTHVRLQIYPDGGVARLRVYGDVAVDTAPLASNEPVDLAALRNGGRAVACSDMFFSAMDNLLLPGRGVDMGDGWETRRRRGPGHDWVIVALAAEGRVSAFEVDTAHFKGNYPDRCSIDACYAPGEAVDGLTWPSFEWTELVPPVALGPDAVHAFPCPSAAPWTHVRLNIYPDGGVSRFRVYGRGAGPRT